MPKVRTAGPKIDLPRTQLVLAYSGPAVESGSMNVYEVSSNLVAFSDFVVFATHAVFGEQVDVKAEVRAFRKGSFETDLAFTFGHLASIWHVVPDIERLTKTVKQAIELFRFLRGQAPAKVEHRADMRVAVTNNNGQITVVNTEALNITISGRGGDAVETFVSRALQKGVESVSIVDSAGKRLVRAEQSEAEYYRRVAPREPAYETTVRLQLQIETASFKDGNKWRFTDGESSQLVAIEDREFLARIDDGEPFRKGDVLDALVRIVQTQTVAGGPLKTEKTIIKVNEHRRREGDQPDLPL